VLTVRRTTGYDPFDDLDDPQQEQTPNVHRISTTPRQRPRGEVRRLANNRRAPQRHGPDPRVWFIRGSIGIAALAGLWLGLQAMFPLTESRVNEAPAPSQPIDAIAVGAPEPPAGQVVAPPPAQAPAEAPAAAPAEAQAPAGAPQAAAPAPEAAQPAPTAIPDRLPGLPAPGAAPAAQAAPPAAQPKPNNEAPSQQPVGKPTLAPIPPPPNAQPANAAEQQAAQAAAQQQAQAAAPKPQASAPAPKPQAAPPAAPSGTGAFALAASASPSNPVSEQAVVTISVKATQNGAPLAGAQCMATAYFRTATVKQPNGGFTTNANGVGSFTLDAKGSTYGHYIPVDVTCSGRAGTVTARTGFTPVKGSR